MNDGGYLEISPHNSNVVFCTGNIYPSSVWNIAVSHTSDGGTSWQHDTLAFGSNGFAVAFDPVDANRVYVAGDSAYNYGNAAFLVSTDLGQTWNSSRTGLNGRVWVVRTDDDHPGTIYCGTYRGVFKSTNSGANWSATSFTRDTRTLAIDPDDSRIIYAGTYGNGVSVSTDGGATWNDASAGLTCNKVLSLALRGDPSPMLMAGTEGGAVFRMLPLTGIAGPRGPGARPSPLAVAPNPCRGKASLKLSFGSPAIATAALFDHSGRLVRDFGARQLAAAKQPWDIDLRGTAAGTYFVRVAAGGKAYITRLAVLD
jgi:hypothetical protein